jgi:radical SAM protein with 4Fe4S-binding SPASM domain
MDINANGDVVACNMAFRSILGNLHASSFEEIWYSKTADDFRAMRTPLCRLPELQVPLAQNDAVAK